MEKFDPKELKTLYKPENDSSGEDNGQVAIVGGSELFHGAPILALTVASKVVDMVFFATPEKNVGLVAEKLKSRLSSFVWVPWDEVGHYIEKSDAVLIGPGFMRFKSEKVPHGERMHVCDEACLITRKITQDLLTKYSTKKWVIDAGSLQTMEADWIPKGAILTPNRKEYEQLFSGISPENAAKKHGCVIVIKGPITFVYSPEKSVEVHGGNPGLTKGGTGDVQAGLTVSLYAKNEALLAASSAACLFN